MLLCVATIYSSRLCIGPRGNMANWPVGMHWFPARLPPLAPDLLHLPDEPGRAGRGRTETSAAPASCRPPSPAGRAGRGRTETSAAPASPRPPSPAGQGASAFLLPPTSFTCRASPRFLPPFFAHARFFRVGLATDSGRHWVKGLIRRKKNREVLPCWHAPCTIFLGLRARLQLAGPLTRDRIEQPGSWLNRDTGRVAGPVRVARLTSIA
jgi:hypothetical protein